ncbi:hypothetical protein NEOLEDRAFT_1063874, partial [Neolentinus lepideus HHB14362 ss-1]
NTCTPGYSDDLESQIMGRGTRPVFRKNGLKPVVSERAEFIANSIAGNFVTQSF